MTRASFFSAVKRATPLLPWLLCGFVFLSSLLVPFRQPFFVMGLEGDAQLHLEFIRSVNDPSLYARDAWLLPSRVLSRGPMELIWYRTAAMVSRVLPAADPEAMMSYGVSAAWFIVFVLGMWRLTVRFGLRPWVQAFVLALAMIPTAMVEGPWNTGATGMNLSRNSYALYPWLLLLLTSGRPELLKGFFVGLASWMYPFLTIHLGFVEGLRRLPSLRTRDGWKRALLFGAGLLIPFSVTLGTYLAAKGSDSVHGVSSRMALVWAAQPGYLDGLAFIAGWRDHAWLWFLCGLWIVLGLYLFREAKSLSPNVRAFFPFFFIPIPIGVAGWFLLPVAPDLHFLQAWRLPIMSSAIALPLLAVTLRHTIRAKHAAWAAALILLLLVFLRVDAFRVRALLQQAWMPTTNGSPYALAELLRQQTTPDALIFAPSEIGPPLRVQGRRAVVHDATEAYLPWFSEERGRAWLALRDEIRAAYAAGPEAVCAAAVTHSADVAVFPAATANLPAEPFACDSDYCAIRCPR